MPIFLELLSSADPLLREDATWALGNIAGDGIAMRDLVLSLGSLSAVIQLLLNEDVEKVISKGSFLLYNLIRGKDCNIHLDI